MFYLNYLVIFFAYFFFAEKNLHHYLPIYNIDCFNNHLGLYSNLKKWRLISEFAIEVFKLCKLYPMRALHIYCTELK